MAYVTGHTYAVLTNQSTGIAYVTVCTSRGVRHGAYVRCFNQSEHGYGVRHGVYVMGRTYAFRPISARHSRILISAAPCGGLRDLAQPHATSRSLTQPHAASRSLTQPHATSRSLTQPHANSRSLKKGARSAPILLLITKLYNFTKFRKLFPAVLESFSNLKVGLIGEWSIKYIPSEIECALVKHTVSKLSY